MCSTCGTHNAGARANTLLWSRLPLLLGGVVPPPGQKPAGRRGGWGGLWGDGVGYGGMGVKVGAGVEVGR